MNPRMLLVAATIALTSPAFAAVHPASGIDRAAIQASLQSTILRAAYEEFVAEVVATFETQADAFHAFPKEVAALTPDLARRQLAMIESIALTREHISLSRRAVLACPHLKRDEVEMLLALLGSLKTRCELLISGETTPRKALLVAVLEKTVVAPAAQPAPPAAPTRTTADVLAEAKRRLRPTGIAFIDAQYQLLLDGKRVKAGSTIPVRLDRDYTVTVAAVTKNSYTLSLEGETLVVSME